jgi:hypothetical protein
MRRYCGAAEKWGFEDYGEALAHGGRKEQAGEVYTCGICGLFHVTRRYRYFIRRKKGRGKTKRGTVGAA